MLAATPHRSDVLSEFLCGLRVAPAVLVTVVQTRGSVPREVGAWMAVFADRALGSIGGGQLEWLACRQAREHLTRSGGPVGAWDSTAALGPSLGQCCGGSLVLRFEPVTAVDAAMLAGRLQPALAPVALFGGGHVGQALVQALAPLPFAVHWIDSRDSIFPADLPADVWAEHSEPVQGAVPTLAGGSRVLIMSFSHAEDLDIVAACLLRQRERQDLPFIGLIGSRTKWASFRSRLRERGFSESELERITCPIGLPGIAGKQPGVIAASVVAQLLLTLQDPIDPVAEAGR